MTIFPTGICPSCKTNVNHLALERVEISEGIGGPKWRGASLLCPSCRTVLGATFDPLALQEDMATSIVRKLRQAKTRP